MYVLLQEKLWDYLLDDNLDLVVSDHSPCTPDLKTSNNLEAWGGISSVQFGTLIYRDFIRNKTLYYSTLKPILRQIRSKFRLNLDLTS